MINSKIFTVFYNIFSVINNSLGGGPKTFFPAHLRMEAEPIDTDYIINFIETTGVERFHELQNALKLRLGRALVACERQAIT